MEVASVSYYIFNNTIICGVLYYVHILSNRTMGGQLLPHLGLFRSYLLTPIIDTLETFNIHSLDI